MVSFLAGKEYPFFRLKIQGPLSILALKHSGSQNDKHCGSSQEMYRSRGRRWAGRLIHGVGTRP